MERIVIINESTFTKWMERVKELLSVLHLQEQQMKNKSLGTLLDTSEVCAMLNLSKRSVQSMRERGDDCFLPILPPPPCNIRSGGVGDSVCEKTANRFELHDNTPVRSWETRCRTAVELNSREEESSLMALLSARFHARVVGS